MDNKKKILLIAPKSIYYQPSIVGSPPQSGLLILATILRNKGHSVRFIDEMFITPDYNKIEDIDVVLISAISATVNRSYFIADIFKNKGKKVILGGIHVSFMPDEAQKHCNHVVIGEAEGVISDIIDGKIKSQVVKGVRSKDLSEHPMPDYSLVESMKKNPDVIGIASSRGCPFSCNFCSLTPFFGRKIRSISTDKIINYLQQFGELKKIHFHDANFTVEKDRVIELLQKMKDNGIYPKKVVSLQSIDVANNEEILKLMSEVSNFKLLIGFESINQEALNFYNKKQTPDMIKKSIKKIHDYNIEIMGNFVFGADTDDKSIFQKTVDFCNYSEIDIPGFDILTPLVGTSIRTDLEKQNRIFSNNWDLYDMQHVVFFPKKMSPLNLQNGLISAYENFFSTRNMVNHLMKFRMVQSLETLLMRKFFKWIIKQSESHYEYLEKISSKS